MPLSGLIVGVDPFCLASRDYMQNKQPLYFLLLRYILAQICCLEGCTIYRTIGFVGVIPLKYYKLFLSQLSKLSKSVSVNAILLFNKQFHVLHTFGEEFTSKIITIYFGAFYFPLIVFLTVTILGARTIPIILYVMFPFGLAMYTIGLGACLTYLADIDVQSKEILRKCQMRLLTLPLNSFSSKTAKKELAGSRPISFRCELGTTIGHDSKVKYFYSVVDTSINVIMASRLKFLV